MTHSPAWIALLRKARSLCLGAPGMTDEELVLRFVAIARWCDSDEERLWRALSEEERTALRRFADRAYRAKTSAAERLLEGTVLDRDGGVVQGA